jgi:hypothetical protein
METAKMCSGWKWWLAAVVLLAGCQPSAQTPPPATGAPDPAQTPDPTTNWAQVLRAMDDMGLTHNDAPLTVSSPAGIAKLQSFFPDMRTTATSTMHAAWTPWIVVHFHTADGKDTFVLSDYRIYRVDDGRRGDFVVSAGFTDYVDRLFATPAGQ